jgi:hypothetical protein
MISGLRAQGMAQMALDFTAYGYLKDWKGQGEALAWLRGRVPPHLLNRTSMIAYEYGHLELLWDPIAQPDGRDRPDAVWLLRAAAALRQSPGQKRHAELLAYYAQPGDSDAHRIGRYLLGLDPGHEVWTVARDSNQRCRAAYYVGLRAWADGRHDEASDWYRVAIETGRSNTGEYRWAYNTLSRWRSSGKSLPRLAAESAA